MATTTDDSTLTAKKRNRLAKASFAIPGDRSYPIPDAAHARNALARVAQNGTPTEKQQVAAAVAKKYPKLKNSPFVRAQRMLAARSK